MAVVSPPTPPPKLSPGSGWAGESAAGKLRVPDVGRGFRIVGEIAPSHDVGQTKEVLAKMAGSRFTSQNKKL